MLNSAGMDSDQVGDSTLGSFHFEDTSFFDRNKRAIATSSGSKEDVPPPVPEVKLSADGNSGRKGGKRKECKLSLSSSRSKSSPSLIKSTANVSILSSFDSICNDVSRYSSRACSSSSTSLDYPKKSSRSSLGYSTMETSKSNTDQTRNVMMTRKFSRTTGSFNLSEISLASNFPSPVADSTHLDNLDFTFKTRDEFLRYEPTVVDLKIPLNSTRRLDTMKIVRSPSTTVKVVLKTRSITPERTNRVQLDLIRPKEIVPANFLGLSSVALELTGKCVGDFVIQMVFCSTCGNFSSKFVVRGEVVKE